MQYEFKNFTVGYNCDGQDLAVFLSKAKHIGEKMLGFVPIATISDPEFIEDDNGNTIEGFKDSPVGPYRYRQYSSHNLTLEIYKRVVENDGHTFGRMAYAKRGLEEDAIRDKSKKGPRPEAQRIPLALCLGRIGLAYDVLMDKPFQLFADDVAISYPIDASPGESELALSLSFDSKETLMLEEQARFTHDAVASYSEKLAFPSGPSTLRIPFARISSDVRHEMKLRLRKDLRSKLPVRINVNQPVEIDITRTGYTS